MPLSDSDIFKAQMYRMKKNDDEKRDFTNKWKELTEVTEDANITLDDIFRYYSHIIRSKNSDKSKEIGLRKFYANDKYSKLKDNSLIKDLVDLAEFWFAINTGESKINDEEKISEEAKKYIHCLRCYPNEFWKYITSVYYFKNKDSVDFIKIFPVFLKKITAFLFAKFIERPTVNAIKDDIYQGCVSVYHNNQLKFDISLDDEFKLLISNSNSYKIAKALILLQAYSNPNQNSAIPDNFEIEHIFPRVWQTANYNGWSKEDADKYLEKYGNKIAIEKKVNIQAGNGYFGKKKGKYATSSIAEVQQLSLYNNDDWIKNDIEKREKEFVDVLMNFFKNQK